LPLSRLNQEQHAAATSQESKNLIITLATMSSLTVNYIC